MRANKASDLVKYLKLCETQQFLLARVLIVPAAVCIRFAYTENSNKTVRGNSAKSIMFLTETSKQIFLMTFTKNLIWA